MTWPEAFGGGRGEGGAVSGGLRGAVFAMGREWGRGLRRGRGGACAGQLELRQAPRAQADQENEAPSSRRN